MKDLNKAKHGGGGIQLYCSVGRHFSFALCVNDGSLLIINITDDKMKC